MNLNYKINSNDTGLQDWNYDLNIEDILHDMEGIKKTDLAKNMLFQQCLSEILNVPTFPVTLADVNEMITEGVEQTLMDEDEDATYHNPIKIPKASKTKPIQLKTVKYTIHDTYSGKKIGVPDKITPSYYFDPASRSYNANVAKELNTFLSNGLLDTPIDLVKYGFTNTTIRMKYERIGAWNYLIVNIVTPDDNFNIKITPNKGEYEPEDFRYPYLGGNPVKAIFFKENAAKYTDREIVKHGKRFIICKLLGDLLHAGFASDGDCVFTNDSYLRDRCIKNKVDVIHREICKKGMIDCKDEFHTANQKGGVAIKSKGKPVAKSAKKELKTNPKKFNQLTIYYYYTKGVQSGAGRNKQIGGSKEYIFQNESNKQNLLNHIDNYIIKINKFSDVLLFNMYGNNVACSDNVKKYIQGLVSYLSGDCKQAIVNIDTDMEIDVFNKELTKWLPQDILYSSEDMATEIRAATTQYFSPTSVKVIFPYNQNIPNEINYFTAEKISFDRFVTSELEPSTMSPYTLNDLLTYFEQKLINIEQPDIGNVYLLGSDEIEEGLELIRKIKNKPEFQNNDDFLILMNHLIDSSFTTEDDLLKAYLMVICGNNEIKAYTMYTTLLPLTYFNGFNIYDYQILSEFVETLGENESLPGGYDAFMGLVIGSEEPETVFPTMKTGMDITEMEKIAQPLIQPPLMVGFGKKQKRSRKKGKVTKTSKYKTNSKINDRKTKRNKFTRRNNKK